MLNKKLFLQFHCCQKREAKARKLGLLINAISKRCWGWGKSIWQFVKLSLRGAPESTLQRCRVLRQQSTLSEIKGSRRPRGKGMRGPLNKGHTLVIKTHFITPLLSPALLWHYWQAVAWRLITNSSLNKWAMSYLNSSGPQANEGQNMERKTLLWAH